AEPIATFRGAGIEGRPAVTRNRWREGRVFYVATDCAENKFFEALAREAGAAAQLEPLIAAPYGVEVTSREDSQATYYFLLNLTEKPHEAIRLPKPMNNLITGDSGAREVSLGAFEVALLRLPR
ncbi:MAG: Beta-galactosidase C-terminal domain, partial [Blastocatellia bacterium]|nr:Beta-galactosidase C-terminal domain [Blastocatellia bacterium]